MPPCDTICIYTTFYLCYVEFFVTIFCFSHKKVNDYSAPWIRMSREFRPSYVFIVAFLLFLSAIFFNALLISVPDYTVTFSFLTLASLLVTAMSTRLLHGIVYRDNNGKIIHPKKILLKGQKRFVSLKHYGWLCMHLQRPLHRAICFIWQSDITIMIEKTLG